MPEIRREVKPIWINYGCDNCKCVLVVKKHNVRLIDPPQYLHACPNCEKEYWLEKVYPLIRYEDV